MTMMCVHVCVWAHLVWCREGVLFFHLHSLCYRERERAETEKDCYDGRSSLAVKTKYMNTPRGTPKIFPSPSPPTETNAMLLIAIRWSQSLTDGAKNICQALMKMSVIPFWHILSPKWWISHQPRVYILHCVDGSCHPPPGGKCLGVTVWSMMAGMSQVRSLTETLGVFLDSLSNRNACKTHAYWKDAGMYLFYF